MLGIIITTLSYNKSHKTYPWQLSNKKSGQSSVLYNKINCTPHFRDTRERDNCTNVDDGACKTVPNIVMGNVVKYW